MKLSLGKAAQAAGASKATLLKALGDGELTGTKNAKGVWQIDPAEVARYRESRDQARQGRRKPAEPAAPTSPAAKDSPDLAVLQVELRMLRERLEEAIEREKRAEERAEKALAEEREARAAFARLIADQRPAQPRGLWSRLTGR